MANSSDQVSSSVAEMAASIRTVTDDGEALATGISEIAASTEEMRRSIEQVAGNH